MGGGGAGMMMNSMPMSMPMMLGGDGVEPGSFEDRQDLGQNGNNGLHDVVDLQGSASLGGWPCAQGMHTWRQGLAWPGLAPQLVHRML
jgi:hypothetical protein